MSSKSLIKLSANNSRDVEQTLGESENRRGDPIVQCSSSARSSSVSGKSNGVGVDVVSPAQLPELIKQADDTSTKLNTLARHSVAKKTSSGY
ncbi:hypothetical protein pdam_00007424 [Pocillopora damicornis]|uniref:Uncharacterized protein n=1 Tax=Pocillopora damicornis TaxID=46731 RepID=A0A3M6UP57_POCDA|nr:hypothetical protein pdam_00007424 [Pocillopora damicornis]